MEDKIIPFGRHKGKPVEVLANDKQYMDWLLAQPWFKEKHLNLYNVVINNFREPIDTPEHNKMQIKFLKPEYRLKLAYLLNPNIFKFNSDMIIKEMHEVLQITKDDRNKYFLDALANPNKESNYGLFSKNLVKFSNPIFETIDVTFAIRYGINFCYDSKYTHQHQFNRDISVKCYIEIKPTIGDDFPSILRQMKASMPNIGRGLDSFYILLVGEYIGIGASTDEFIEYFATQGYRVVFESEIDKILLPPFDRELKLDNEIEFLIKNHKL